MVTRRTIRLPEHLDARLDLDAFVLRTSRSEIVRRALEQYLSEDSSEPESLAQSRWLVDDDIRRSTKG